VPQNRAELPSLTSSGATSTWPLRDPSAEEDELVESKGRTDDHPIADLDPAATSLPALAVLATVIGLSALALWTPSVRLHLWLDEVITIAIAERSIPDIVRLLELDGSPPLYYLLASVWQSVFGVSEIAARALPLTIGVLAVALGSVAIARRVDLRTGWIFGALAVVTPGVLYYATEARQYSLLFALGLVSSVLLFDEINAPSSRRRVVLAVVLASACYTHNWGVFLTAGTLLALVATDERPFRTRVMAAAPTAAVVAILYLPWLTLVLRQASTTGAPWLAAPTDLEIVLHDLSRLFGTAATGVLAIGVVVIGRFIVRERGYDGLLVQATTTVALGWVFSVAVAPAFTYRYLMIAVPPVLLMLAISASHERKLGFGVLATGLLMVAFTTVAYVDRPIDHKSRAVEVAERIDSHRQTGANVAIVAADTSLPAVSYYLDDDLDAAVHYLSFRGAVTDPQVVDWSHVTEAMIAWRLEDSLLPVLDDVDVVIFLNELAPMRSNRVTDYWRAREVALERADADLAAEPRLQLTDEWRVVEWIGRVYEVDP
jgi:hypothetical protein